MLASGQAGAAARPIPARRARAAGISFVLDASGPHLQELPGAGPDVVPAGSIASIRIDPQRRVTPRVL